MNWVKPSAWLALLLLSMLSIIACSQGANTHKQTVKVNERKTIPSPAQTVSIKTPDVPVRIQPSMDQQIQLHFHGYTPEQEQFQLNTKQRGEQLQISLQRISHLLSRVNKHTLRLDVQLPNQLIHNLNIQTASGDITLKEYQGEELLLDTATGSVVIENVQARTSIKTITAPVQLQLNKLPQDIDVQTESGDVNVYLPDSAAFAVDLKSVEHKPKIEFDWHQERSQKHGFFGTIGNGGSLLRMDTKNGHLNVLKN